MQQTIIRFLAVLGAAVLIIVGIELAFWVIRKALWVIRKAFWVIGKAFCLAYRGVCWLFNKMTVRTIKTGKYAGRKVYNVGDGVEVLA